MAVRTWPGSTPDVMPAFARGHLGEADGCMSSPSPSTAGSLPNPPWGGRHMVSYMPFTCNYCIYGGKKSPGLRIMLKAQSVVSLLLNYLLIVCGDQLF